MSKSKVRVRAEWRCVCHCALLLKHPDPSPLLFQKPALNRLTEDVNYMLMYLIVCMLAYDFLLTSQILSDVVISYYRGGWGVPLPRMAEVDEPTGS